MIYTIIIIFVLLLISVILVLVIKDRNKKISGLNENIRILDHTVRAKMAAIEKYKLLDDRYFLNSRYFVAIFN